MKTLDFGSLDGYVQEHSYAVKRESLDDNGWSLAGVDAGAVLAKITACGVPLGEYVNDKIYRGVLTGLNEAFVIDAPIRAQLIHDDPNSEALIKPFLMGRDVKRYEHPKAERHVILMPNGWTTATRGLSPLSETTEEETVGLSPLSEEHALSEEAAWAWLQETYPAIARHLAPFAERAGKRWDRGQYWWELRACDYYEAFERPKILYPDLSQRGNFMLDVNGGEYCGNTTYFFPSDDLYLLGVLNSQLTTLFCKSAFANYRGGYIRFFQEYVTNIPIRKINFDDPDDKAKHDRMVELVETMLRLKREHAAAEGDFSDKRHELAEQIEYTDRQIDRLVYELYGLTEDEIRVVEGE